MLARRGPRYAVMVGFLGKTACVDAYSTLVRAEHEAKSLRAEYPDHRAEFWVSSAHITTRAQWKRDIEPRLSRDGVPPKLFRETTKRAADRRVMSTVWDALRTSLDGKRIDPAFYALPYTADELISHLSDQFSPGMSWENYGEWHIDHIEPRAAFDMRDPAQMQRCWALENLQPLWAADNRKKHAGRTDDAAHA